MSQKVAFKSDLDLLEDANHGSGNIATNEAIRIIKKPKISIIMLIKRVNNLSKGPFQDNEKEEQQARSELLETLK